MKIIIIVSSFEPNSSVDRLLWYRKRTKVHLLISLLFLVNLSEYSLLLLEFSQGNYLSLPHPLRVPFLVNFLEYSFLLLEFSQGNYSISLSLNIYGYLS